MSDASSSEERLQQEVAAQTGAVPDDPARTDDEHADGADGADDAERAAAVQSRIFRQSAPD